MAKNLIAVKYILYRGKQYSPAETLPVNDSTMVERWLKAGSAKWDSEGSGEAAVKAVPKTAQPGLSGETDNAETVDPLVGKVPKTATRSKK